ncbi:MBL fold metallo-hydrolase [Saccharomonospora halophila]|uniref:MBL fold metallo-hydrolase n=1 Tax=Saccharomonospora halophila TaxID=129922 RepID=UPI00035D5D07|nr:MBL fold metallo-hydrolase [Saccharomonospora halophila]
MPDTGTHVVTLGTAAGPVVRGPRQGIATAIVVDGALYLVDVGLGVTRQLSETGMPVDRLRAILLTHLHSDHICELPGVLLYNWGPNVGGFDEPFPIVGPGRAGALPQGARPAVAPPTPGTEDLVGSTLSGYAYDVNIRVHDEGRTELDQLVQPRDIRLPEGVAAGPRAELAPEMSPLEVYRDEQVRVLAALVEHPPVFPCFGFRIETPHGVVALSGDTTEHPNVVRLARGADVLVHEAMYLDYYRDKGFTPEYLQHLANSHTDPAGAGRVAAAAGARHLVFSHLGGVATYEQWADPARESFGGTITVADDGQMFSLGGSR